MSEHKTILAKDIQPGMILQGGPVLDVHFKGRFIEVHYVANKDKEFKIQTFNEWEKVQVKW